MPAKFVVIRNIKTDEVFWDTYRENAILPGNSKFSHTAKTNIKRWTLARKDGKKLKGRKKWKLQYER